MRPWFGTPLASRCVLQLKLAVALAGTVSVPIGPVTRPGLYTRMSLTPCPIALEPSITTSPAFMTTLRRVRRVIRPPPYELVRHSVLARLPAAPLGHRLPLPAAPAATVDSAMASAVRPTTPAAFRRLGNGGAPAPSLRCRQPPRGPHP